MREERDPAPREGPDPVPSPYRFTPAFAAGIWFAAFLIRYVGGDIAPRSAAERERVCSYLERVASAEWRT
jgi:hypothetical protein